MVDHDNTQNLTEKEKINKIGGYWALKDVHGQDYSSLKLRGSYYLLYFGFTLCPDVCPLSVQKLDKVVQRIKRSNEAKEFFNVRHIFVTVNPDLDNSKRLKQFASLFDPSLILLTAESSKSDYLLNMLKIFKVPVGLSKEEAAEVNKFFEQKKKKEGLMKRLFGYNKSQYDS